MGEKKLLHNYTSRSHLVNITASTPPGGFFMFSRMFMGVLINAICGLINK
jgi:hypothetical protein